MHGCNYCGEQDGLHESSCIYSVSTTTPTQEELLQTFDKIVGALSHFHYHSLLPQISLIRKHLQDAVQ